MENKTVTIISVIIIIILLALGIWYFMGSKTPTFANNETSNNAGVPQENQAQGNVYFTIKDQAAAIENVTNVHFTIDKIEAFSTNTQGWATISQESKTFDLLELKAKNQAMLLAKVKADEGMYSKIRYQVAKVTVTESGVEKDAKLPSGQLTVIAPVRISANADSVVMLDVFADKSLHKTGKGEFIFTPVINLQSTSRAKVNAASNNAVTWSEGALDANVNAGMDLTGQVKANFMVDKNTKIQIQGNAMIGI